MSQYVENIIQEKMDKINSKGNVYEVGRVIGVTDYIVEVSGLIQVSFNEKVVIAGHSIGYVSLIRRNSILVSVLQSDNSIFIGDEVIATRRAVPCEILSVQYVPYRGYLRYRPHV